MSLRALRDPMNEVILKLKMAGTHIRDEEDLETFLLSVRNSNYSRNNVILRVCCSIKILTVD